MSSVGRKEKKIAAMCRSPQLPLNRKTHLKEEFLREGRRLMGTLFSGLCCSSRLTESELQYTIYKLTDYYMRPATKLMVSGSELDTFVDGIFAARRDGYFSEDAKRLKEFVLTCIDPLNDKKFNHFLNTAGRYIAHHCELYPDKNSEEIIPRVVFGNAPCSLELLVVASGVMLWDAIADLPDNVKISSLDPCPVVTGLNDEMAYRYNSKSPRPRFVKSLQMPLQTSILGREQYDYIHLRNIPTYIPDYANHLDKLIDALKNGGRIILQSRFKEQFDATKRALARNKAIRIKQQFMFHQRPVVIYEK